MSSSAEQHRTLRLLQEAEGYLELGLPERALEALQRLEDAGPFTFAANLLRGLTLRDLGQYADALVYLEAAAQEKPDDLVLCLTMGWCLKRTGQIPRAIEALHRARAAHPNDPLLQYNLACYYSLAGQKQESLHWLRLALEAAPQMRELIPEESDFEPLRDDPDFEKLASGPFTA